MNRTPVTQCALLTALLNLHPSPMCSCAIGVCTAVSRHHCNTFHTKPRPVRYVQGTEIHYSYNVLCRSTGKVFDFTITSEQLKVPGHTLPETRTNILYLFPSPLVHHPLQLPPNPTHCIECTCILYCNSMIPCKWQLRTVLL